VSAPTVIVLAAGRGARFLASGGATHKLNALVTGKPVLSHVLDAVAAAGLAWHLVQPDGGTGGMGESIALGVLATPDASGWLILPGDLPLIQPDTLRCVAAALRDDRIVVPHYQQRPGHPPGFGRAWFSALASLTGDVGARAIVQEARGRGAVADLATEDIGVVQDVDTLADLSVVMAIRERARV